MQTRIGMMAKALFKDQIGIDDKVGEFNVISLLYFGAGIAVTK